uniref:Uncharacterized protein n=1 Tax=Anguilla anguilla TaxID=7936 RepID=A0A0E9XY71_ANGAN
MFKLFSRFQPPHGSVSFRWFSDKLVSGTVYKTESGDWLSGPLAGI